MTKKPDPVLLSRTSAGVFLPSTDGPNKRLRYHADKVQVLVDGVWKNLQWETPDE